MIRTDRRRQLMFAGISQRDHLIGFSGILRENLLWDNFACEVLPLRDFIERASKVIWSAKDLHVVLDAVPTPLLWASLPGGDIQFNNRAFSKTFGYADDRFKTFDDLIASAYPQEEDRHQARDAWETLWQDGGIGLSEIAPIEIRVLHADGSLLTVQLRGILLHDIGIAIATFEDISAHKKATDALRRIGYEDPLTGAGNRRALDARWQDETSGQSTPHQLLAVLLIDLDDFKPVNDCMGHDVGDAALVAITQRLRDCIRRSDLLFRIGGDEFVILLPGLRTPDPVKVLCDRIGLAFNEPFLIQDWQISLGATIGASLWPQDGTDLRELLQQADAALYRLKRTGKGGWDWFHAPPDTASDA